MLQNWTKVNIVLWILDKLVYISMHGMYFIYQGEILKDFRLKMTIFAVYEDKLTEPLLILIFSPLLMLHLKRTFKYTLKQGSMNPTVGKLWTMEKTRLPRLIYH